MREVLGSIYTDEDFVDLFLLRHQPYKLLLVTNGNDCDLGFFDSLN